MYIETSEFGSGTGRAEQNETSDLWWSDIDQYLDTAAGQAWMSDMAEAAESAAYGGGF